MGTVRAAVCRSFGAPLTIEEVILRAPGMSEVEVTLDAVAICHSDITYIDGGWGGVLPAVYGHEAAGIITATGPDAGPYEVGDRVLVTLIRSCGSCACCVTGRPAACETPSQPGSPITASDGCEITQGMYSGAFAEKVVVHRSQLARLPDAIPSEPASLLACGVITGVGAVVNSAGLRAGQDVVVIGAGGVGLNVIQGAAIAGARRIVAVDMVPEKLDAALEFGATDGILGSVEAPWEAAKASMGRGADAVFVAVGAKGAFDTAQRYMATGGKLIIVGMPEDGVTSSYAPADTSAACHSFIGSKMGDVILTRDIPWMADLYLQGRLKLDELISGRWSLDQINEAIADTRTGKARRNVIVFS